MTLTLERWLWRILIVLLRREAQHAEEIAKHLPPPDIYAPQIDAARDAASLINLAMQQSPDKQDDEHVDSGPYN